jgi:hypothetical protein
MGVGHKIFANFSQKETLMTETEQLEYDIAAAQQEIADMTRVAVQEATTSASLLKQAKGLADKKEALKILRLRLDDARGRQAEAQAKTRREQALEGRREIAALAAEVSKDAAALASALKRAAPHYNAINAKVAKIMGLGVNAADFDLAQFKSARPSGAAYELLVHLVAKSFSLTPKNAFHSWPRPADVESGINRALTTFVDVANWPEDLEPEVFEFEIVNPEGVQ